MTPVEGKPETIFEYLSSMLVVSSFLPVLYAASTITDIHIHIHMEMKMDTYTDINSTVVRTHEISRGHGIKRSWHQPYGGRATRC